MARYLVTGGAGFIGSHLCETLVAAGHTVHVLDNLSSGLRENLPPEVHFQEGDIRDEALLARCLSQTEGCFHLAAIVSIQRCNEETLAAHSVNLTGTLHVLEGACREQRSRPFPVVFASSCAVYGDDIHLPHEENQPIAPLSLYAVQKAASEYYGYCVHALHGVPFTALRLFNVYGTRQKPDSVYAGVIPVFLTRLKASAPCQFYGDGSQSRDFIAVKDVAAFFLRAMETSTATARTFNACTGVGNSIHAVAQLLSQRLASPLKTVFQPARPGDILHSRGNPDKAAMALGISATIPLASGLQQYVEAMQR